MTNGIVPLFPPLPPPEPVGALICALAGGVLGFGLGQSRGFNVGYEQRDQEVMPYIDSLRREIFDLKSDLQEERRIRSIAQHNVKDYYGQLQTEQKRTINQDRQIAKLQEILAENGIDIPE